MDDNLTDYEEHERRCGWPHADADFPHHYVTVFPLSALFGVVGNVICAIVLCRKQLFSANSFFMLLIAILDIFYLIAISFELPSKHIKHVGLHQFVQKYGRYVWYTSTVTYHAAQHLVVFAVAERLIALCCAKTACCRQICLRWICTACLLPLVLLADLFINFSAYAETVTKVREDCEEDSFGRYFAVMEYSKNEGVWMLFQFIRELVAYAPAILFDVGASIALLCAANVREPGRSRHFLDAVYRTAALGLICFAFAILPFYFLFEQFYSSTSPAGGRLQTITELSKIIYASVKFPLYLATGALFREETKKLFGIISGNSDPYQSGERVEVTEANSTKV